MQKKRLSLMLAAGTIAGPLVFAAPSGAMSPEAQALDDCDVSQNRVEITFRPDYGGNTPSQAYCKAINSDIQIKSIAKAKFLGGIVWAKAKTQGEAGSCTFYLITREGDLHRKFNLRSFQDEKTTARANTYFGFRLGC